MALETFRPGLCAASLVMAVVSTSARATDYHQLYAFKGGSDGWYPSTMINVNGALYGVTAGGGGGCADQPNGCGTVVSVDPQTGQEKVLYSFKDGQTDGEAPQTALLDVHGTLYGMAYEGGQSCRFSSCGTVFSISPATGTETVLHFFTGSPDGNYPYQTAALIHVHGILYGTTLAGGDHNFGTVFSINRRTGAEKVLYSFGGPDGLGPSGLIVVNGMLYGTILSGGSYNQGAVFSVDPATGAEKVLHSFQGGTADGEYPYSALVDYGGMLYGTTASGGQPGCTIVGNGVGCGTVFSIDPTTGAEKIVYRFNGGTDGAGPQAALINVKGRLYGTTFQGGGSGCTGFGVGCGTVFRINPAASTETVLYRFGGGTDGSGPNAALINIDGLLYGTTSMGGSGSGPGCGGFGCGTVFSVARH